MASRATEKPRQAKKKPGGWRRVAKKDVAKTVAKAMKSKRGNRAIVTPAPAKRVLKSPAVAAKSQPPKEKAKRGRPSWEPTNEERRLVEHYVSIGMTQEEISLVMERSIDSLQRHCRHELDAGRLKVNAKVAAKLFDKAMKGDTASLIFWMKSRAGWKERSVVEHAGEGGGPVLTHDLSAKEAAERYREKLG